MGQQQPNQSAEDSGAAELSRSGRSCGTHGHLLPTSPPKRQTRNFPGRSPQSPHLIKVDSGGIDTVYAIPPSMHGIERRTTEGTNNRLLLIECVVQRTIFSFPIFS